MTEYDYSPAAYDKYLRTQARVSKWVAAQVENSTEYDNPFIPVVATESSRKLAKSSPKSRSSTASASSSTLQQTKPPPRRPVRSGTEPPRPSQRDRQVRSHTIHGSQPGQVQQDRTSVKHRHPKKGSDLDDPHQSSYSHRTRSSRRAGHTRSSSTGETYTVKRDPNGNTIVHLTSKSAGEVINLPPPRANGGYVIVAPPHVKVEVMVCLPLVAYFLRIFKAHSPFIRIGRITR